MPEPRRVVVTGLGAVTPVGNCVAETWTNLLAGCSGIATITLFDPTAFGVRIGGEVKNFKPEDHISSKDLRHMDRSSKFALVAGKEAVADAALDMSAECAERVGVVFGTAAGGVSLAELEAAVPLAEQDRGRAVIGVNHGQVGDAILVEVSGRD